MYIYIYIYTFMHVCTHVWRYIHMYTYTYVYIHTHAKVGTSTTAGALQRAKLWKTNRNNQMHFNSMTNINLKEKVSNMNAKRVLRVCVLCFRFFFFTKYVLLIEFDCIWLIWLCVFRPSVVHQPWTGASDSSDIGKSSRISQMQANPMEESILKRLLKPTPNLFFFKKFFFWQGLTAFDWFYWFCQVWPSVVQQPWWQHLTPTSAKWVKSISGT